ATFYDSRRRLHGPAKRSPERNRRHSLRCYAKGPSRANLSPGKEKTRRRAPGGLKFILRENDKMPRDRIGKVSIVLIFAMTRQVARRPSGRRNAAAEAAL